MGATVIAWGNQHCIFFFANCDGLSDYAISLWSSLSSSTQRWMNANRTKKYNKSKSIWCSAHEVWTENPSGFQISECAVIATSNHMLMLCDGVEFLCGKFLANERSKYIVLGHLYACEYRIASTQWGAHAWHKRTGNGHAIHAESACATYFIRILCAHPSIITHARLDSRRHEYLFASFFVCPRDIGEARKKNEEEVIFEALCKRYDFFYNC